MVAIKRKKQELQDKIQLYLKIAGYKELTPLQEKVIPLILQNKDLAVKTQNSKGKTAAYIIPLFLNLPKEPRGIKALVITDTTDSLNYIAREFKRFTSRKLKSPSYKLLGLKDSANQELSSLAKEPDIVVGTAERIIDHMRRNNLALDHVDTVVIQPLQEDFSGFDADIQFIYTKLSKRVTTLLFFKELDLGLPLLGLLRRPGMLSPADWETPAKEEPILPQEKETTEEKYKMSNGKITGKDQLEALSNKIKEITDAIRSEDNPELLNLYRKTIRKNVPLTLRPYFGAYLLKQLFPLSPASEKDTVNLFVNIGKTRKVYPKDLSKLFSSLLQINHKELGNIKVMDNYSFIEIPKRYAEKAIQLIDGTDFRGKKITVNYARKREE